MNAVAKIEAGPVVPLYNLDVAGNHSFFVGQRGMLVHDNTLPPARLVPFDAVPVVNTSSP